MGQPRSARRKALTVISSDEDCEERSKQLQQRSARRTLRSQTTNKNGVDPRDDSRHSLRLRSRSQKPVSLLSQPNAHEELSQVKNSDLSKSSKTVKQQSKSKPIFSFFNSAAQRQQSRPSSSPEKVNIIPNGEDEEDFIEDDSLDEELVRISDTIQNPNKTFLSASTSVLPLRKRPRPILNEEDGPENESMLNGSQKFLKASKGYRVSVPPPVTVPAAEESHLPWTERFKPLNVGELAVHTRKVADVRSWLTSVLSGQASKRLLVLKGGAGTGKTTTISLLAKDMGIGISEWKNPLTSDYSKQGYVSVSAQFEDFVSRAGKYRGLEFAGPISQRPESLDDKAQMILIEEFPNTFARSSAAMQSFRTTILQYLAANTSSTSALPTQGFSQSIMPIVMIISETLLSTNTVSADRFTAYRLLGPEILSHPGVSVIEFNPIAETILYKALEEVIRKEARKSGRRKIPGPEVLRRLSTVGDVRSAVSALEFLCVRGDEGPEWGSKITFSKSKKTNRQAPLTKMEQESLEMVTQRENALGIFHAVGKVIYNKRQTLSDSGTSLPQPPTHFPQHRRPKKSEVDVEKLIDELGTDVQTFISALHENYVLSCHDQSEEDTLDSLGGCIDVLSDSDLLSPNRFSSTGFMSRTFQGFSGDSLRQDEMSFNVSVRGILFNLPSPVIRRGSALSKTRKRNDAHQMFYPSSLRLWRRREELEDLLDLWAARLQSGQIYSATKQQNKGLGKTEGGVETWRRNTPFAKSVKAPKPEAHKASGEEESPESPPILLAGGSSARNEMLLERLPFMVLIERAKGSTSSINILRDMEKAVTFSGIGHPVASSEEVVEEEDITFNSRLRPPNRVVLEGFRGPKGTNSDIGYELGGENDIAKLVLSDDDIVDSEMDEH